MRKFLLKLAIFFRYLMRGLHSADVEAFEGKSKESEDGVGIEQQQETNNVYKDLLKGEVTQAVKELRYEMYQAERKSHEYRYNGGGSSEKVQKAIPKNILINEGEKLYLIQRNWEEVSTLTDIEKQIEDVVSEEKRNYGERILHEYVLSVARSFLPSYKIEEFTKKLVIKKLNDEYILDFYTSMHKDPYNKRQSMFVQQIMSIENGDNRNSIVDIESVSFITKDAYGADDLHQFIFDELKFNKVSRFNGDFVIDFTGRLKETEDLTIEFYDSEAERKNNSHEMRDGATVDMESLVEIKQANQYDADKAMELINEKIEE